MSRLRLGFLVLVAILLLLLLTFAPDLLGSRAVEPATSAPAHTKLGMTRSERTRISSPLVPSSPLATVAQSPLPTPVSPPSGYMVMSGLSDDDPRRVRVSIYFDRPMDKESITWALRVSPPVATLRTWEENVLVVEPSKPLHPNEPFTLVLTTDATDSNGLHLAAELRYDYWVPPLMATLIPPSINNVGEPLLIDFNYPMYGESVLEALRIEPAIPGNIQWDLKDKQIVLYPDPALVANTSYTFSFVDEMLDVDGQVIQPPSPVSLITAPPFMPADYGLPFHPALPLRLRFDRVMDATSVEKALTFSPPVSVTQGWIDTVLTLTPTTGSFDSSSLYRITLQPTATSLEGDFVVAAPYYHDVVMSQLTPLGDFGYGPNLQMLLAGGPRTLQYQAMNVGIAHKFELYALTPTQFLTRYVDDFAVMNGNIMPTFDMEDVVVVATWEEAGNGFTYDYQGQPTAQATTLPRNIPPGLYLLQMTIGSIASQIFVALTEHNVVIKQGAQEVVAWLTDSEGAPTVGAEATIYGRDGSPLATATSDTAGLLHVPLASEDDPLLLMAEVDDGAGGHTLTLAGFDPAWNSRASTWSWGWPAQTPTARAYAVHLYTDRPIYRPGQTLYYKAIIRDDNDARLTLPGADTAVRVRLRDARNNVVRTIAATPNNFGTLDGKFKLAEGAMVGEYRMEVEINGEVHDTRFQVQEYRKPDFTVEATTNAPVNATGEDVTITVDSRFLWGEPVANAAVTWQRYYIPPQDESYGAAPIVHMGTSGETRFTTADGSITLTLPASDFDRNVYNVPQGGLWGVEVTVEDEAHQSVSASVPIHFVDAPQQIQIRLPEFQLVGEPFVVEIFVTDGAGEPAASKWLEVSQAMMHQSGTGPNPAHSFITVTTDANGIVQVPITIKQVGLHYFYVRELTLNELGEGRVDSGAVAPSLSAVAQISMLDPENEAEHLVVPYEPFVVRLDRTTYLPGEEAKITILSRFGGPAWLTMERGEVHRTQVIELTPPMTIVTTTITAEDAPNLFVTVNGWEATATVPLLAAQQAGGIPPDLSNPDAFLHNSTVKLHVPMPDKTLLITLTADQAQYAPRQEATFTITVTDHTGQPVEAELSLALVDEAIFALADDKSGPIFDAFYYPRPHTVNLFDSMAPTRYIPQGRGGGGGEGYYPLPRHDFRDTVAWRPSVMTGADGVATVTLTLPDNLTTWRLTVKAVTGASTQVGEVSTTITTWQPLVVRPLLPRGLTAGDYATLSATLHNESDIEQAATVWLETTSPLLQMAATPTETVKLAPGEVRVVGWPVTATTAGTVSVTIVALTTSAHGDSPLVDAVENALRINPLAIAERTTNVGQFGEFWETTFRVPEGALPTSALHIELNRSVAGSFVSGLEFLTGFPYGCVEQTMSRALPNAVVSRAFKRLGLDTSLLHPDLPGLVDVSVQRLYGFQHQDGGWGWWYDDPSHDYQTAWVLYGLAMTAQSGYEVDTTVIARGTTWLMQTLGGMEARTQAFALYSIALASPMLPIDAPLYGGGFLLSETPLTSVQQYGSWLLEKLDELDAFSLAALLLAFDAVGDAEAAQTVLARLLANVAEDGERAYWSLATPDGHYEQKTMASATRSTALALTALLQADPNHALIPKVARWLMDQRQTSGWGSTNETAFALVALTDYLLATAQTEGASDYVVEINGQEVARGSLDATHTTRRVVIPAARLVAGENHVMLRQSGETPLYYRMNQEFVIGQMSLEAAGNIRISRHYADATTGEQLTTIEAGQVVRVVLDVMMPSAGFYMLVEDGVPGGLEPLNESLNTTSYSGDSYEIPMHSSEYGYNYKEIYGDRVRFFVSELAASSHRFSYLARATHTGRFVALPTEAWAMYNPQLWGRSTSQAVTVAEP